MNTLTSNGKSQGFYAGCNTIEKRQRRRLRNTLSVRKFRERQKLLTSKKEVHIERKVENFETSNLASDFPIAKNGSEKLMVKFVKQIRTDGAESIQKDETKPDNQEQFKFGNFQDCRRPEWFGEPF